ncbi:hypothetical protein RFI_09560, partial [Reticulomyxa filosa]
VIVVRKDLNMSAGKVAAQCCHGAVGLVVDILSPSSGSSKRKERKVSSQLVYRKKSDNEEKEIQETLDMTSEQLLMASNLNHILDTWISQGEKKIVLKCDSERQLFKSTICVFLCLHVLEIRDKAAAFAIPNHLVADAGHTEIEPGTKTVVALGPYMASIIDRVTGFFYFVSIPNKCLPVLLLAFLLKKAECYFFKIIFIKKNISKYLLENNFVYCSLSYCIWIFLCFHNCDFKCDTSASIKTLKANKNDQITQTELKTIRNICSKI